MTIHTTHKEDATGGTAAPSGQTSELACRDDSTSLTTLQHRIGHIRLKARVPGACIALEVPGSVKAVLLTIDEARQLIGALADLIGDIEMDARARDWSRRKLAEIVRAADASAESYDSLL